MPLTIFPALFSYPVSISMSMSHLSLTPSYFSSSYFAPFHRDSNLFVSNLFLRHYQPRFSLFSHSLSYTTYVSVTAGRLVDLSLSSRPLTSISSPSLLLTNLWTALAVTLPLKKVGNTGSQTGIEEISVFCQDQPSTPKALHIISKSEATQS